MEEMWLYLRKKERKRETEGDQAVRQSVYSKITLHNKYKSNLSNFTSEGKLLAEAMREVKVISAVERNHGVQFKLLLMTHDVSLASTVKQQHASYRQW